jgi:hypothetical protein
MKKLALSLLTAFLLLGCYSTAPLKNLNASETATELESMNGTYRTRDSRENKYSKIAAIDVLIRQKSGSADIHREGGRSYKLHLWSCELANVAQAKNFGKPFESVESLVRCDILSSYKYAHIYIGKVKKDYVIRDQKVLSTFEPMQITTGYVIHYSEGVGSATWLSVTKE